MPSRTLRTPSRRAALAGAAAALVAFVAAGASAVPQSPAEAPAPQATLSRLKLSESLRKESLTIEMGNVTEGQSATVGKVKVEADLVIPEGADFAADKDTAVLVSVGAFRLETRLGADIKFRPDRREAKLPVYGAVDVDTSVRVARATVRVKWGKDRISVTAEGDMPGAGASPAAEAFLNDIRDRAEGAVAATVRVGPYAAETTLPIRLKGGRQGARSGNAYGEVHTVEVSGEVKAPRR